MGDGSFGRTVMGVAAVHGWSCSGDRANRDDLPGTLLLNDRGDRVAAIHAPKEVHLHDKLQERRIEGAGFGVHGPTTIPTGIRDQDINPTPFPDDPRDHCLDRLVVTDINLDPQSGAAGRLDLGDRANGGHVLRFGLEFLIGAQIEVGDRDPTPNRASRFADAR